MSNINVKSRATFNPSPAILIPGGLALVLQVEVQWCQVSEGWPGVALSQEEDTACSMDFLLILEDWTSNHFQRRARHTAVLALSASGVQTACRSLHSPSSTPTSCGCQNQTLKWFLLSFSRLADPYLASLGDSLSTCWQTVKQGHSPVFQVCWDKGDISKWSHHSM